LTAQAAPAGRDLARRVATAVVGVPLLVGAALLGGAAFLLFLEIFLLLATFEFHRLAASSGLAPHRVIGLAASAAVGATAFLWGEAGAAVALAAATAATLLAGLRRPSAQGALADAGATLMGTLYVGWLGSHMALLERLGGASREVPVSGARALVWVFVVTWICDTAAYGVGRAIGRRRLLERVSPKKSVEGAVAGFVAAVAGAVLLAPVIAPCLTRTQAAAGGVIVGALGQAADLGESLLKRGGGVKDTAKWLPGHGGLLDRFDSLLLNVPGVYYLLRLTQ
jgi:phosphatidate cytidylyltransferase